jgi:hypothetical protein
VSDSLANGRRLKCLTVAVGIDNGQEFTSWAFIAWAQGRGIRHILIEPSKPVQNGHIESFNGRFRDECLNAHWFETLQQAGTVITKSRRDYNEMGLTVVSGGYPRHGSQGSIRSHRQTIRSINPQPELLLNHRYAGRGHIKWSLPVMPAALVSNLPKKKAARCSFLAALKRCVGGLGGTARTLESLEKAQSFNM